MGLWGLLFSRRMVLVEVARVMVWGSHHSEGTTSNSSWCGTVGQEVPLDAGVIIWQWWLS